MLFGCKKEPVRLAKKENNKTIEAIKTNLKYLKCILSTPEVLTILIFIIIFGIAIGFAIHESIAYFVYNTGGI